MFLGSYTLAVAVAVCFRTYQGRLCLWVWGRPFAAIIWNSTACLWEKCSSCTQSVTDRKELLANNVSLKVSRLFSHTDLTNSSELLTSFAQDLLEKRWVLIYCCISAKQSRRCLPHCVWCLYLVFSYSCWGFCSLFASIMLFSSLWTYLKWFVSSSHFTLQCSFVIIFKWISSAAAFRLSPANRDLSKCW